MCVPSGVTEVEKRAVEEACQSAGARQVQLIEECIAAAIGSGLPIEEPRGHLVVDVGGGTSEVALISWAGIVVSESLRVGGYDLDEAISITCGGVYRLAIGQQTAEDVKLAVGSAIALDSELETEIRGGDVIAGLPKSVTLTSEEVRMALEEPLVAIVDAVKQTLERTPPSWRPTSPSAGSPWPGAGRS